MARNGAERGILLATCVSALLWGAVGGMVGGCTDDPREGSRVGASSRLDNAAAGPGETAAASRLKEAARTGDPVERSALFSSVLTELGPESVDSVREFLQTNINRFHPLDAGLIFQWWSRYEPRVALDWLTENDTLHDVGLLHRVALGTWASQDFDAANEFFEEQVVVLEGREAAVYAATLLKAGYDSSRPELMPHTLALPLGLDRQRFIRGFVRRKFFFEEPEAVVAWAEGLSAVYHPRFKLEVNRRIGRELGAIDPAGAMSWASRVYQGDYGDSVLEYVTRSMILDGSGPEAMEWLRQLSPGDQVDDAVRETYRFWRQTDLEAATAWIEAVPIEPWLEPAFAKYVLSRSKTHGREMAFALAEKFQNEELRRETLGYIGRSWFLEDPERARSWAESQDFDDRQMRMIVAPPGNLRLGPAPGTSSRAAPRGQGSGASPP